MSPEAESYLILAAQSLEEADKILAIGLYPAAARSAYYAAFHAAEALVYERTGRPAKTHSGLRASFAALASSEGDAWMRKLLATAYDYKEIADYSLDRRDTIASSDARHVIEQARQFLDAVAARLSGDRDGEH